jgi:hypothetical protein
MSLAGLKLVAQVGTRQGLGSLSVNQLRGNKNPSNPEIRWFLGTAIKSRLRAAPYLDTRKQKDAAPKAKEGLHQKKEEKQMNYMDFDPYVIRERNEQVHREVNSLRLEERLREDRGRGSSGSRFVALAKRGRCRCCTRRTSQGSYPPL